MKEIKHKTCSKCKVEKEVTEFSKNKKNKNGLRSECKDCQKQWRARSKDYIVSYRKQHYKDNKEAIDKKNKRWNEENKESVAAYQKQWRLDNKEASACYFKEYRKNNKDRRNQRERERIASNPLCKLKHNTSTLVRMSITRRGYTKRSKTANIIGCSYEEYKNHLEAQFTEGMNWDNLGLGGWVVDHRLPNSAGKTEEEVLVLNHHRNLQPMWEKDNLIKGDKYCPVELEAYFSEYLTK